VTADLPHADLRRFRSIRAEFLEDVCRRRPTFATSVGIHDYDDQLEDYSADAMAEAAKAAAGFQRRLEAVPADQLPLDDRLDREQLILQSTATVLGLETVRPWATSPDYYSSRLATSAYAMVKRAYAPAEERLRGLVRRLRQMPAALDAARRNLHEPPQVFAELALQQLDGNIAFFATAVPQAFETVDHPVLLREFQDANGAVVRALVDYRNWLRADLLPRSAGAFACGAEVYRQRLWADEMIDTPLDELLDLALGDLTRNQTAFVETARRIDPSQSPREVLADVERHRPAAADLLRVTQEELDALKSFLRTRGIVTVPDGADVRVQETPPFLRATSFASLELPGPFEQVATEVYYNMTLPDPAWTPAEQDDFMRQWYQASITNASVHEVWPGHHLQFLHVRQHRSDVRRIFGSATNVEGWAHYAEQMVIDEGFHGDDPRYRLAQLQDALLRNARFVVGIRMHTAGMTLEEAEAFFRDEAWQTPHVARAEARRGTFDATYGYYTLGKLLVLRLREEYRERMGPRYSLRGFHDALMAAGPMPLPLVRTVVLGDAAVPTTAAS